MSLIFLLVLGSGPEPQSDRGDRVRGTVEDDAGQPRPGVTVWLSAGGRLDGSVPVLERASTDAEGRFVLEVPPLPALRQSHEPLSVWAHEPGSVPARHSVPWATSIGRDEIELSLVPAGERRLRLVGPDGEPVAGAKVVPDCLGSSEPGDARTFLSCPDELGERLGAVTDAAGEAVLAYLARADQALLKASAGGLGTQTFFSAEKLEGPITLGAAGRVVGRVVADEPAAARGVVLAVRTKIEGRPNSGTAHVRADDQGRFEVPSIAAGEASFEVEVPAEWPFRAADPSLKTVEAGRENRVEVVLKRAVRLGGTVRERGTSRPVAGAWVAIGGPGGNEVASSDAEGRFEGLTLPGHVMAMVLPWSTPRPFFTLPGKRPEGVGVPDDVVLPDYQTADIPADAREWTLPAFELIRGDEVQGTVIDSGGRPVPEARVEGQVMLGQEGARVATTTDAAGRFTIKALNPTRKNLKLEASTPGARTAAPVEVPATAHAPIVLRVGADNLATPTGRVVDESGRPVEGAEVELWSQEFEYAEPAPVTPGGLEVLRTGPDGTYRVPRPLRVDWRYRVLARARAAGLPTAWSDWVRVRPGQGSGLPDLVLGHPRALAGRVVDRSGRPVAGALVRSVSDDPARPQARTDDQGSFRLEGCAADTVYVFAEARGFRFRGWLNGPESGTVELTLARPDEPAEGRSVAPPPVLPAAEETALALKIIEPQIRSLQAGKEGYGEMAAIRLLARVDPTRALEVLDEVKPAEPGQRDYLKARAARRLFLDRPDEALAIIEAAGDPWIRADGYRRAGDALPDTERAKKLERFSQALINARGVKGPELRLILLGNIARRMHAAGASTRAAELFREGRAMAGQMPVAAMGGYARGAFAEDLAEHDLPVALALIEDLSEEGEFDRHHGNIAQRVAARDPAEAERIWGMIKGPVMRDGMAHRVSYRMAATDRERARRIAGKIGDPHWRAYALGTMASALAERDRDAASRLLDEALAALAALPESSREAYGNAQSAAATTALLLPVAERIDPARVSEVLWRALSLRGPCREDEHEEVRRLGADAVTAMLVSRHDHAIAQALLGPILDRLPALIAGGMTYFPEPLFAAPAIVDPRRAVALVEGLPPDTDPERGDWGRKRLLVAEMLSLHGADRWRKVVRDAGFWDVDGEDLVDDD